MRSTNVIGQKWKRAAGISLSTALLSAVAVVAFTLLGSKALMAYKAPGTAEKALASGGAFEGLLDFAAPSTTVTQLKTKAEESEKGIKKVSNDSILVKDWRFTQNSLLDVFGPILQKNLGLDFSIVTQNTPVSLSTLNAFPPLNYIAIAGALYFDWNFFANIYAPAVDAVLVSLSVTNPALANVIKSFLNQFNAFAVSYVNFLRSTQYYFLSLIPPGFQPPPIPPVSPSI